MTFPANCYKYHILQQNRKNFTIFFSQTLNLKKIGFDNLRSSAKIFFTPEINIRERIMKKPFKPHFQTPKEDFSKEEINKLKQEGLKNCSLAADLCNDQEDIVWESEQIAKSTGIYLEFDRSVKGAQKNWYYMIRIANPAGGPISREQWQTYDELSERHCQNPYGSATLRVTNRQTIQFHWIKKNGVIDIVKTLAEVGMNSLNGCGDNTRNVMACPLSRFSKIFNASDSAHKIGEYFQLPIDPYIKIYAIDPNHIRKPEQSFAYGPNLLNRKFKIAFSAVHKDPETGNLIPDNCVEMRTHDMSVAPIIENDKVSAFQIYIGGGQGEKNGKPTMAALGLPFAIVNDDQLLTVMDSVVQIHQEWGDRQNRHWARLKYVVKKQGIDWYRDQVSSRVGFPLQKANPDHDMGDRHLHHGFAKQESNGLLSFGAFLENGRINDDGPNGKLKSMIRETMNKYPVELALTPNQDLLFSNIPIEAKEEFENHLKSFGYGQTNGKAYSSLRLKSGACVGRDTCRLTYTDSEKFEPELITELEKMGWGDQNESIGITGCERQCFRPATKTIGLVGTGLNRYMFKLFGDEAGRHQGVPLMDSKGEFIYLRSVTRENVPVVINALFKFHKDKSQDDEDLGEFLRRVGSDEIIQYLQNDTAATKAMNKPFNTDCVIE